MNTSTLILIYLGIALLGSLLPAFKVYFAHFHNLVNLVISACLEGGKIHLYRDGSGQTTGIQDSSFKKALISYAGYTGTLAVSIGLFYLVSRMYFHLVIYLFFGFTVLALLIWVRNLFGVLWGGTVAVLLAISVFFRYYRILPGYVNYEMVLVHISIFLASVLFIQSIIRAIQIFKQCFMSKSNPSRKAAIVQTKFIPAVVLGLTLVVQTFYAGIFFVQNFISLPFSF